MSKRDIFLQNLLIFALGEGNAEAFCQWQPVFDGYGGNHTCISGETRLTTAIPSQIDVTHGHLLLLQNLRDPPADMGVRVENQHSIAFEFQLERQLRQPTPNPWESLWLFLNYAIDPDGGSKQTNYLAFKTNGIEFGKAFGETGQQFLFTAAEPAFPPGVWHEVKLLLNPVHLEIWQGGSRLHSIHYSELKAQPFNHPGHLGIYVEDATVRVRNFRVL